jgi:hypothetical protein
MTTRYPVLFIENQPSVYLPMLLLQDHVLLKPETLQLNTASLRLFDTITRPLHERIHQCLIILGLLRRHYLKRHKMSRPQGKSTPALV